MSIKLEIFSSTGCSKCIQAKANIHKLIDDYDSHCLEIVEIDVLEQLDYAVQLGVLATPALAIDGKLCFTGLPSVKKLRKLLDNTLKAK